MKKIMKLFVLVAAAAMTLASCQKNEISGPVTKEVHFTINAGIAETKTTITDEGNKKYTPKWESGDKIGVLFALEENAQAVEFANTADAGETATFKGKHAFTVVDGASKVSGNLYAFYPSSAFNKVYKGGEIRLDLKATQNPTSTSFDPSCDLLIAKPCHYMAEATGEAAEVDIDDMYFARMMSVLRINLNSTHLSNEIVKSVSFDADGVDFTGAMRFNLETGEFVGNQSASQDLSEVKADYSEEDPIAVAGEKNSAYLVVAPVTIPSGTALTFTIETEKYDIVKTINAPADMVMPAGNIAVINLTIAEENCTAKTEDTLDYSGEWLIVNSDLTRAANAWANGNNLPEFELTTNAGVILESDGIANCKMKITKEADGYTIQDASGMYLYAAGASDKNHLYGQATKSYWTIEKNETNYVITSLAKADRNILRYNSVNKIFSCYSSGQDDVTLYRYSEIIPDTTPRITVEKTEYKVSADDETLEFSYTTKNIDGTPTVEVATGATMTIVEAKAEADAEAGGTVTVTFDANADEKEKTATLVLSYEGAEDVYVTITQAAKAAEGAAYYEKVTSAPADWSGNYLIVFGSSAHATNTNNKDLIATTSVSITDNKIAATDALAGAVMTVTKSGDKYNMTYPDGKYFGMAKNASTAVTSAFDLTFIYTDSGVKISGVVSGTTYILYSNSGNYFRCYTDKTGTSGYTLPNLYKLSGNSEGEGGETPEPELQERNLAFSSTTATATVGEEFDEPTLNGATAGVTYSSSNTSVATVNETTGAVTLVAAGETTITATAVADETYAAGTASYTLTVSTAQGGGEEGGESTGGTHYVKVTSTPTDWTGEYLIVYETGNVAFDGGLTKLDAVSNTVAISISNGQIAATSQMKAAAFTINNSGHIQAKSGKYVGNASNTNALPDLIDAAANTLSIDNSGNFVVKSSGGSYLRYNATSGQTRFRYYKSSSYTNQKAIQLYKLN